MMALRDVFFEMFPKVERMMEILLTLHPSCPAESPKSLLRVEAAAGVAIILLQTTPWMEREHFGAFVGG